MSVKARKGKVTKRRSMKGGAGGNEEPSSSEGVNEVPVPSEGVNEVPVPSEGVNEVPVPSEAVNEVPVPSEAVNVNNKVQERSYKPPKQSESKIHIAAAKGNIDEVKALVNQNIKNINKKDYKGWRPLDIAIRYNGNLETVKYLIDNNAESSKHEKLLHLVLEKNDNSEILKYLIDKNTDIINKKNEDGLYPLDTAVKYGKNIEIIKYLTEKGAISARMVNADVPNILTVVINISRYIPDYYETVKYIIDKNPRLINIKDGNWDTPLTFAIKQNAKPEIVKYLIDNGSDLTKSDANTNTPLHLAVKNNASIEIIKYLIGKGANVNLKNYDGDTPLHLALSYEPSIETVKYLIEKGADIRSINKSGELPLHLAANPPDYSDDQNKNLEIITYILEQYRILKPREIIADIVKFDKYKRGPFRLYESNAGYNKKFPYGNVFAKYMPSVKDALFNKKPKVAESDTKPASKSMFSMFSKKGGSRKVTKRKPKQTRKNKKN